MITIEKEYCKLCNKQNYLDQCECGSSECGSRDFVFGEDFEYKDGRVLCGCGCSTFKQLSKINRAPILEHVYACTNCNNKITSQTHLGGNSSSK